MNANRKQLSSLFDETYYNIQKGRQYESLEKYSTFTELSDNEKWLFNLDVLRSFYGGYHFLENIESNESQLLKLALINSIMEVSNASKDGKCLRYKKNWQDRNYCKIDFVKAF